MQTTKAAIDGRSGKRLLPEEVPDGPAATATVPLSFATAVVLGDTTLCRPTENLFCDINLKTLWPVILFIAMVASACLDTEIC